MRRGYLAVVIALLVAGPLQGQEAEGPAIRGVIQGQIDAFLAEDPAGAFAFASPMIQRMFGTSENFGSMVQGGYPMIWKPSSVQYLGLRRVNGSNLQRVLVRDATGAIHLFDYEMVALPEGWRINGVFPVQEGGAGA